MARMPALLSPFPCHCIVVLPTGPKFGALHVNRCAALKQVGFGDALNEKVRKALYLFNEFGRNLILTKLLIKAKQIHKGQASVFFPRASQRNAQVVFTRYAGDWIVLLDHLKEGLG
jgi:hypothetical protein